MYPGRLMPTLTNYVHGPLKQPLAETTLVYRPLNTKWHEHL